MKFNRVIWHIISLFMVLIAFQLTGCGSSGGGGGGGGDDTDVEAFDSITLEASSDNLGGLVIADGVSSVLITANTLNAEGDAISGIDVTFETSAGAIEGAPAGTPRTRTVTSANGVSEVKLISPVNVGIATVTVSVDGVSYGSTTVEFGPGPLAQLSVSASPSNLTVGQGTSTITAIAMDANDNAVADGETLSFSAIDGTLSSFTAVTSGGIATVTYSPPSVTGNDTVTVESTNGVSATTTLTIIGPTIGGINLSAEPASIPADGTSSALIYATVTAVGGGDIPDNTTVNFSILEGEGHGTISSSAETAGGIAVATLTSSTNAETVTVRAVAGGRRAEINVNFTSGSVEITIVPNSLLATGESEATVTAKVLGLDGSLLSGEEVAFTVSDENLGSIDPSGITGSSGEVQVTFTTKQAGGDVVVTATWVDENISASDTISVQPPPEIMQIAEGSPDPESINIQGTGGESTSIITFDVKDASGNLVADGYRVDFSIESGPNGGEYLVPSFTMTKDGQVTTTLKSGTKSGPVDVKVTYFYDSSVIANSSQIAINAGLPVGEAFGPYAGYLNISGLTNILLDPITISAADVYGNSIPDNTAISFKTYLTGGTFVNNTATTLDGEATDNLRSAAPEPDQGFSFITAEATGGRTTHVTSIAVSDNFMYAGTSGGGVYKSINSGALWNNISRSDEVYGQNVIDPYVNDICIDPDDSDTLYAATGYQAQGHVYRSTDGGNTWNSGDPEEWNGLLDTNDAVLTVLCDDNNSDYVWAGTNGLGAVFSSNGEDFNWGGIASDPVLNSLNPAGKGYMTIPELSASSKTESWAVIYTVPDPQATVPQADSSNTGNGFMSNVSVDSTATLTESWTVQYNGTNWIVRGSSSGVMTNQAANGVLYVSDNGEVSFTITISSIPFDNGDSFTFATTASDPYWQVVGSYSGLQLNTAETGISYSSDNPDYPEISFSITEGATPFEDGDYFSFDVEESGLGYGKTVKDIIKANGNQDSAELYAATRTAIYRSENGGLIWEETDDFSGDNINVLAHHPDFNIVYAGTEEAGVWWSDDDGVSWTQDIGGLGEGVSSSAPAPDIDNTGNGIVSITEVFSAALSETWTVTCTSAAPDPVTFSVIGTESGLRATYDFSTDPLIIEDSSGNDLFSLSISNGIIPFAVDDFFTFKTVRDEGMKIKDLLVDPQHDRLYCITYFQGPEDPHAVGNVYSVSLGSATGVPTGEWTEANSGLPQYDPPDDSTLFAQHVMAANNAADPSAIYIGGEGINFYKTSNGLDDGNLQWNVSKTGMGNQIMARMPILFTGACDLIIDRDEVIDGGLYRRFFVRVEDANGNPPIAGSNIKVTQKTASEEIILLNITYPDAYTYRGTFSDPSDTRTYDPYIIIAEDAGEFIFTFTPENTLPDAPGSSGGDIEERR